ncbi:MAG TPA: metal ABC transporter substrate-binding protein [Microvirga sp.]|nr:metal ABC transporter substrate-binding protein [Microvirga sp.]
MPTRRNVITLLSAALAAAAAPARAQGGGRLKAVATFSILADFVRRVGGERVEVTALVGPDGDAHVYAPTPADSRRLAEARLVVANGLGFEGWIARLIRASGTKAPLVEAAKGTKPLKAADAHGHGHGADPHAWQNVAHAKVYVAAIRDALIAADPEGRGPYEAQAAAYLAELDALDAEIRAAVAQIPPERRRAITSHEAFAHFEAAYGLDFVAPQGVSTEAEPSAKDVARIIQQIRRERIPAVFVETIADRRVIERIAQETGARIGERLYSDALSGADGPAPTYIAMMRHNMRALGAALAR